MRVSEFALPGLVLFEPTVLEDERGEFFESYNERVFRESTGFVGTFVQDNQSLNRKGVLRGLHYQVAPHEQGKLVRVVSGAVFDVAVDVRPGSATFGQWAGVELSAANRRQLWISPGFAHGFIALVDRTIFLYKVSAFWHRNSERTIRWDDPKIAIEWPLDGMTPPVLSEKDSLGAELGMD